MDKIEKLKNRINLYEARLRTAGAVEAFLETGGERIVRLEWRNKDDNRWLEVELVHDCSINLTLPAIRKWLEGERLWLDSRKAEFEGIPDGM